MKAHDLAKELLKLPKNARVFVHGSWDDCYGPRLSHGKYNFGGKGKTKVVILFPEPESESISTDYLEEEELESK